MLVTLNATQESKLKSRATTPYYLKNIDCLPTDGDTEHR